MIKSETAAHHQFIAKFLAWAEKGVTATTLLPHSLFRGQADNCWATHPSLARIHTALKVQQLKLMEQEVIQEFRKKNDLSKETWDDMDVLAFARHHGAPTRLLDWSQNALVALWFTVQDSQKDGNDGKILNLNVFTNNDKIAPAVGDLWLDTVEDFKTGQRVISFTTKPCTDRMQRQGSVFTIASYNGDTVLKSIEDVFGITDDATKPGVREFLVPAILKPKLRVTLSKVGLDAFNIYGGPDALGLSIADKYNAFFQKP